MRKFQFFSVVLDEKKDEAVLVVRGVPVSGIIRGDADEYRDLYTDAWGVAEYCDRCAMNGGVDLPDPLESLPVLECQAKMRDFVSSCMNLYRRANELGNTLKTVETHDRLIEAASHGELEEYFRSVAELLQETSDRNEATPPEEILEILDEAVRAHEWDVEAGAAAARERLGYSDQETPELGV